MPVGVARSFSVPTPLDTREFDADWPAFAVDDDGSLGVVEASGALNLFDRQGDARFSAEGYDRVVAMSQGVLAVSRENSVELLSATGQLFGVVELGGDIALAARPDGGFVAAFDEEDAFKLAEIELDGSHTVIAAAPGWQNRDQRPRSVAVRSDGAIGVIFHGVGQPREFLGQTLANDLATDSGERELLAVLTRSGMLEDVIAFRSWGGLVELTADHTLHALSQQTPIGSATRSLVSEEQLALVRWEATRASLAVVAGPERTWAEVVEFETPSLVVGETVYVLRPSPSDPHMELSEFGDETHVEPLVLDGECRGLATNLSRLFAVCSGEPMRGLADRADDTLTGWAVSLLRAELSI
jgi:hypothetical protein